MYDSAAIPLSAQAPQFWLAPLCYTQYSSETSPFSAWPNVQWIFDHDVFGGLKVLLELQDDTYIIRT